MSTYFSGDSYSSEIITESSTVIREYAIMFDNNSL